jgi:hypothetical protein
MLRLKKEEEKEVLIPCHLEKNYKENKSYHFK